MNSYSINNLIKILTSIFILNIQILIINNLNIKTIHKWIINHYKDKWVISKEIWATSIWNRMHMNINMQVHPLKMEIIIKHNSNSNGNNNNNFNNSSYTSNINKMPTNKKYKNWINKKLATIYIWLGICLKCNNNNNTYSKTQCLQIIKWLVK